ncbi:uncharacterized protein with PQ loop repeat [Arthrobacter ginsengisoli]|uniref:Uncharacterized protein with PQ loop repeat n=1 Tax=Arthrobacter ginsengisoli TaxID=1356565 RepID=A0ABU1UAR8_9MICC|nr:hypothetical protein [Arthrobacter ginsengisoli]MDR7082264.1 uncharacterized protein with PQ loop repeat [Arthrobacter ginsengisoli]
MNLPVLAGILSTALFAVGMLPMLVKAARTKDLASYSFGNLMLTNVANAVHSVYVFNLPAGPIWTLHMAYLLAYALMLAWWLRYRDGGQGSAGGQGTDSQPDSQPDSRPDKRPNGRPDGGPRKVQPSVSQ